MDKKARRLLVNDGLWPKGAASRDQSSGQGLNTRLRGLACQMIENHEMSIPFMAHAESRFSWLQYLP
jgi:hypothetical protein